MKEWKVVLKIVDTPQGDETVCDKEDIQRLFEQMDLPAGITVDIETAWIVGEDSDLTN